MPQRLPVKKLERIKKHRYILKKIATAKANDRKKMLYEAPKQLFTVFKDICQLVTDGHIKLGKIKRHQRLVNEISRGNASTIKSLAKQKGSGFGAIISGLLPMISPLLSKLFK
jgi:hypothetical protein